MTPSDQIAEGWGWGWGRFLRILSLSENKSDIILNENIAFNYLPINYFSLGHQVSPLKPLLD